MKHFFTAILLCFCTVSIAQTTTNAGLLSGSIESISQYYKKDTVINALVPIDKIGNNTYLRLDYSYKNFAGGVQFESYMPLLVGYPGDMKGGKLVNKYFTYRGDRFEATVGDFYEQFGSGLVFRSFENRQIGINNALEGINVKVQPTSFLSTKFVYGRMRKFFEYSDGYVRGGDATIDWTELANSTSANKFTTGISVVDRYDEYLGSDPKIKPNVTATSLRAGFDANDFHIDVEHVSKSSDAHFANYFYTMKGNALLINSGYSKDNLGINLTMRRLANMDYRADRDAVQAEYLMNFIPAITRQHDFALSNIYVYNPQALGEIGGQFDFQYNFAKGTKLGGKYGANLAINYSQYNSLDITSISSSGFESNYFSFGQNKYFGDLNIEFKKKLNNKVTSTFMYQNLYYNKSIVEGGNYDTVRAHITAADFLIKYAPKKSVHLQAQHLYTKQDFGSWLAGLVEFGYAPNWTWFVQSLYNYGNTKGAVNYYTFGTSYTHNNTRLLVSYGRQRQGLVCVGGVCRLVPANTGLSVSLTTNF